MKSIAVLLVTLALVADAQAGIFRRSGCSTSSNGCSVSNTPARNNAGPDLTLVPITRPARPEIVAMKGDKGDKGEPGAPGQVTQDQIDKIVQSVTAQLLPQMAADERFRGKPGADAQPVDIDVLAGRVADKLPPIRVVLSDAANVPMEQVVKLGGTLTIPPVRLQAGDGAITSKSLGSTFKVTAIPVD